MAAEVDFSLPGERVARALDQAAAKYGCPEVIVMDNGPEFTGKALDQWAYDRGVNRICFAPLLPGLYVGVRPARVITD